MEIFQVVLFILSWFLVVAVVLPFVKNDYWIFRILEYPRYQKFILCVVVLAGLFYFKFYSYPFEIITISALGLCTFYLLYKILPYTPFYKKEMNTIKGRIKENQLILYTANVYQDNRQYKKVLQQIHSCQPHLILLLETDSVWEQEMSGLKELYPNTLKEPLSNKYGLLFFSRFPIINGAVKYIVDKNIPSIEATIELPSKQQVKVWGLHPKPPVPGEDTRSTAKDKELLKVAFAAKKENLPIIVMGDLNDVAWSYVTELFRKTSGLLDPRRGRGFFSTFSANSWFMRFPLDYVFCSSHFGLINMKRLDHNGSDHFPMYSHFEFVPALQNEQEKPHADSEEQKDSVKKAES